MTAALTLLDLVLGAGILTTATIAVLARDRVVSVMMFLALGVLLAVLWARLEAPDLAMAEAAIAAGVTGALLMSAVTALSDRPDSAPERGWSLLAQGALVVAGTAALGAAALASARLGGPRAETGDAATAALADSVVDHPITAVLLQFRSYDTLLEVVVLATAAIAAVALPRTPRLDQVPMSADQGELFDGFVRVAVPVVLLLAGWLLVAGSSRPGGAFQAGALVTGLVLLLYFGQRPHAIPTGGWLMPAVAVGPAAFTATALATAGLGAGWLHLAAPWGGTVVVLVEAALAVSIGISLTAVFIAGRAGADRHGSGAAR